MTDPPLWQRCCMTDPAHLGRLIPVTIDGVDLLIRTLPVSGSEEMGANPAEVTERVSTVFDRSQEAVVAVAARLAGSIKGLSKRGLRPAELSFEFGISISATGNLIIAGPTPEAALKVSVVYKS